MQRMSEFTKKQRLHLRKLAGDAYERELGSALGELYDGFEKWKGGDLYASELSERIHEFHQGIAQELYSRYNPLDEDQLVARAVAIGLIEEDQVEAAILKKLDKTIEFFRS